VDFDEQTIYLEHDAEGDRLVIVINYRGFYAAPEAPMWGGPAPEVATQSDIEDSEGQLRKAVEGKTVALLGNWPFLFPMRDIRRDLIEPGEDADLPEQMRRDLLAFMEHLKVYNAGFYTDAAGRACGAQVLVVEGVSEVVPLANRLINQAVLRSAEEDPPSDETEKLWVQHAGEGHAWIELDGQSLICSVPVPEEEIAKGRRSLAEDLLERYLERDEPYRRGVIDLLSSPIFIWQEGDLFKVRLGLASTPSVLVVKPPLGDYEPNMEAHIRETYGLEVAPNLARYLVAPDTAASSEAEIAARIMAPRLTKRGRVRALVARLKAAPSEPHWERLRQEGLPEEGEEPAAERTDEDLLVLWEDWLKKQAVPGGPRPEPEEQLEAEPAPETP
jgi:hypothetical protein